MPGSDTEGRVRVSPDDKSEGVRGNGVAMEVARNANRRRVSLIWIMALFFAIAWHAVWWLWLSVIPIEARLVLPETPKVSYMPISVDASTGEGIQEKIRTLWSPALFALPTQVGFSRSILTNEIGVRPPLAMPDGDSRFLEREPSAFSGMRQRGLEGGANGILEAIETYALHENLPPVFTSLSVTGVIMKIEFFEGLAGQRFMQMELPELPDACKAKPWEAIAYLEIDSEGRVKHVFLEKRSPSEQFDTELVQQMLSWRLADADDQIAGRIILRCFVSTRTASKPPEGGSP